MLWCFQVFGSEKQTSSSTRACRDLSSSKAREVFAAVAVELAEGLTDRDAAGFQSPKMYGNFYILTYLLRVSGTRYQLEFQNQIWSSYIF